MENKLSNDPFLPLMGYGLKYNPEAFSEPSSEIEDHALRNHAEHTAAKTTHQESTVGDKQETVLKIQQNPAQHCGRTYSANQPWRDGATNEQLKKMSDT